MMTADELETLGDRLNAHVEEQWGDLSTLTFDEIGVKLFGDTQLFFAAGQAFHGMCLNEDLEPKKIMSVLAGLLKVAYNMGRESATQ